MVRSVVETVCGLTPAACCGGAGGDGFVSLAAGAAEVARAAGEAIVPLPSSAMMGLALIGGFLLFGRIRPRKTRQRRSRS